MYAHNTFEGLLFRIRDTFRVKFFSYLLTRWAKNSNFIDGIHGLSVNLSIAWPTFPAILVVSAKDHRSSTLPYNIGRKPSSATCWPPISSTSLYKMRQITREFRRRSTLIQAKRAIRIKHGCLTYTCIVHGTARSRSPAISRKVSFKRSGSRVHIIPNAFNINSYA